MNSRYWGVPLRRWLVIGLCAAAWGAAVAAALLDAQPAGEGPQVVPVTAGRPVPVSLPRVAP